MRNPASPYKYISSSVRAHNGGGGELKLIMGTRTRFRVWIFKRKRSFLPPALFSMKYAGVAILLHREDERGFLPLSERPKNTQMGDVLFFFSAELLSRFARPPSTMKTRNYANAAGKLRGFFTCKFSPTVVFRRISFVDSGVFLYFWRRRLPRREKE